MIESVALRMCTHMAEFTPNMKYIEPGGGVTSETSMHEVSFGRTVPELQAHRGIS